jgi:hypothetical protein
VVVHQQATSRPVDKAPRQAEKEAREPTETREPAERSESEGDKVQGGTETIKIEPKNIYDCILGFRNEQRAAAAIQKLPQLIRHHP